MKTHVTETSRQTYLTVDLSSVRGRVLREISRLTKEGKRAYISLISKNTGMDKSNVSGRLNELKKAPFQVNGEWFRLDFAGEHAMPDPFRPGTFRRVETWGIVRCEAPAEQLDLFSIAEDVVHGK